MVYVNLVKHTCTLTVSICEYIGELGIVNKVSYYFLNQMYDVQALSQDYQEHLSQVYEYGSHMLNYNIEITKGDFQEVFNTIYSILRFRIDDKDFEKVSEHYLKLLMADARDGNNVNVNWFINHVWYLCVGISNEIDIKTYRDCISFIQQILIKKFDIQENIKEKVRRKIYAKFMTKC